MEITPTFHPTGYCQTLQPEWHDRRIRFRSYVHFYLPEEWFDPSSGFEWIRVEMGAMDISIELEYLKVGFWSLSPRRVEPVNTPNLSHPAKINNGDYKQ